MLTPEQTRDLVDHFGSQRAAGRAIGVTHPTICYWLRPGWAQHRREVVGARYDRLTGAEYNRLLLRHRRAKALSRRTRREEGVALHG